MSPKFDINNSIKNNTSTIIYVILCLCRLKVLTKVYCRHYKIDFNTSLLLISFHSPSVRCKQERKKNRWEGKVRDAAILSHHTRYWDYPVYRNVVQTFKRSISWKEVPITYKGSQH